MVVTFLMMLVVALLAVIFRVEFEAWMPWIAERLRRAALRPLKGPLRDRYDEEWASHLDEMPGHIGKVIAALGFNWASREISIRKAAYQIGYRSTVGVSIAIKDAGKSIMKMALFCDRFSGFMPARFIGWVAVTVAFDFIFFAMDVMHARTRFIEDEQDRVEAELRQRQSYDDLMRKIIALGDDIDAEPEITSKE